MSLAGLPMNPIYHTIADKNSSLPVGKWRERISLHQKMLLGPVFIGRGPAAAGRIHDALGRYVGRICWDRGRPKPARSNLCSKQGGKLLLIVTLR